MKIELAKTDPQNAILLGIKHVTCDAEKIFFTPDADAYVYTGQRWERSWTEHDQDPPEECIEVTYCANGAKTCYDDLRPGGCIDADCDRCHDDCVGQGRDDALYLYDLEHRNLWRCIDCNNVTDSAWVCERHTIDGGTKPAHAYCHECPGIDHTSLDGFSRDILNEAIEALDLDVCLDCEGDLIATSHEDVQALTAKCRELAARTCACAGQVACTCDDTTCTVDCDFEDCKCACTTRAAT